MQRLDETASKVGRLWCHARVLGLKGADEVAITLMATNKQKTVQLTVGRRVGEDWSEDTTKVPTMSAGIQALSRACEGGQLDPKSLDPGAVGGRLGAAELLALFQGAFEEGLSDAPLPEQPAPAAPPRTQSAPRKAKPPSSEAPASLLLEVREEDPVLERERQQLVKKWGFTRDESVTLTREVQGCLLAVGRDAEALDVARAWTQAVPDRPTWKSKKMSSSGWECALGSAAILSDRGGPEERAAFERRYGEQGFEFFEQPALRRNLLDLFLQATQARFIQPPVVALSHLAHALVEVILRQQVASLAPYRGEYLAEELDAVRAQLTRELRAHLAREKPVLPSGWVLNPERVDLRWQVMFLPQGGARAEQKTVSCPHCHQSLTAARCAACPAWFIVRPDDPAAPFACRVHGDSAPGETVVHRERATLTQRQCNHCGEEALPFKLS